MASTSKLIESMNSITLDDEEDGEIVLGENDVQKREGGISNGDGKLRLVGKFLNEGIVDFSAMQQTLAALWRPGKGVYIRELNTNLYVFQFYHEVDIKTVLDGSPWSFNRKALIIKRMEERDNPRSMNLDSLNLWV